MKNLRLPVWLRWLLLGCALGASGPLDATGASKAFRAGAFAMDVTPTNYPVVINGGFLAAFAQSAVDRLHARCLVLDDGQTRVGLCVLDSCLIPRELADQVKVEIQKATGLAPDHIMISATHTHFAPSLMQALGTPSDPQYIEFLRPRLVEGFRRALNQLEPARVGWNVASAPGQTHCRVWIRRPDRIDTNPFGERAVRANMHPGYQNPDTIGPSGPSDSDMALLSVQALSGRPIALLANFGMHYHGDTKPVSADYYGRFAVKIAQLLGATNQQPPFVGIMSQGFSGDQHWMDYSKPARNVSLDAYAETMARIAYEACQTIQYHESVPLAMLDQDLVLATRQPDEKRLAWAKEVVGAMQNRLATNLAQVYAAEQLWLRDSPTRPVKLQVLRVGGLGITMTACEVFALSSLKLKAKSPLQPLMNIELANGEEGYIPPPEHHWLGSYNTWACRSAGLEVNAEPKVVDALLGMLETVSGEPRRPIVEPPSFYAQRILKAEPLAYWRMNEFGGPVAVDATRSRRNATYEKGVVFYLDGPTSSPLSDPSAINRAPHFAGGRMVSPMPVPGSQYSVEMWVWNGLPPRIRGLAGYLLEWGDRLAIGGTNGAQGRLVLQPSGQGAEIIGTKEIPLKTWTHLVFTRDDHQVSAYVNGLLDLAGEASPNDPASRANLYIGGRSDLEATFEGKIDEVAVYDRPLGAAEVLRHFQDAALALPTIARVLPDPSGPYVSTVLELKPAAYWRLGENGFLGRQALDTSGRNHPATYEEGLDLYQAGPVGQGFAGVQGTNHAPRFTGGRLRSTLPKVAQNYSVSLWFCNEMANNVRAVTGYIFSRGPDGAGGAPGDHLGLSGTHLKQEGRLFVFNGNKLDRVVMGKTVIPPRTWNHVLLVREGRKVSVYLNGRTEPEIAGELEISPGAASEEMFVGGRNDNFANFDGLIDEVVLFDRSLSSQAAQRLYADAQFQPAPGLQQKN